MKTRVLSRRPSMLRLYGKAALPSVPGVSRIPGIPAGRSHDLPNVRLRLSEAAIEPAHLVRYRQVCGFSRGNAVPATYPHVLAFPLQLSLMSDLRFPFPPMGVVHILNSITQTRPVEIGERLDLQVFAEELRGHPRGHQVTLVSEARAGDGAGEPVWQERSVMLRRGHPGAGPYTDPPDLPDAAPAGAATWHVAAAVGRRYAAVSGDRNPIHLFDVTAKAFGFRRHIAHGMWTMARTLAELENRLPEAYTVDVAFKRPLFLPGSARFGARSRGDIVDFGLTSADDGARTHLLGRVTTP